MFGGSEETVRIRFHNRFVGVVIDRFGKDVPLHPDGGEHFIARVEVAVSEQFFRMDYRSGQGCADYIASVRC